ncbi:MAG: A/G-specific adenine glycosylase, partial [Actinomycetota bacterium]
MQHAAHAPQARPVPRSTVRTTPDPTPSAGGQSPTMPASALHAPVLAWYAAAARDLPWRRDDATPWGVLVSEVMLQQTPVARVLPVWEAWLA